MRFIFSTGNGGRKREPPYVPPGSHRLSRNPGGLTFSVGPRQQGERVNEFDVHRPSP
jgi:hypothetical protein